MKVILDMDGVLVNFVKGVNKAFDLPDEFPPPQNGLPQWNWFEHYKVTNERVNNICNRSFWADLEWMPDGHDIMRIVTHYFSPHNIYLCTLPMPNSDSASGKVDWVNRHLPAYARRLIIATAPKSLLAGPDKLLIDDRGENTSDFRAAGGWAILVARPWNSLYMGSDRTTQILEYDIQTMRKAND